MESLARHASILAKRAIGNLLEMRENVALQSVARKATRHKSAGMIWLSFDLGVALLDLRVQCLLFIREAGETALAWPRFSVVPRANRSVPLRKPAK
jgi:hypothetical protein